MAHKPASWQEQAETFKVEAERLPYGAEREALELKARQLEIAVHLNQWASSPGLQPPE
jgi:tRNA(Phe) wybutosine-synthesizing methylase Tyw3